MSDASKIKNHGRETYAVYYGDRFVLKRPLPKFGEEAKINWLQKQYKTKQKIDEIRSVANPVYNIPEMIFINDEEFQILEERAPGQPLTAELYNKVSKRQKFEIVNSIASFLVDMNELKPIGDIQKYNISHEIKLSRLNNFIENKMNLWFTKTEVSKISKIRDIISNFEYETYPAWSHGDLNSGNVLYDPQTSKLSFIDFAEAHYKFIYRDIFSSLQIELDIYKNVYEFYYKLHNKSLYPMLSPKSKTLREIMKNRLIVVLLRRFIKASDDLRIHPANQKSINNNMEKIFFMRRQIQNIEEIERRFIR